jgi:hypothetical protein
MWIRVEQGNMSLSRSLRVQKGKLILCWVKV